MKLQPKGDIELNLSKLFKTQAELDNKIIEEKGLQGQDLLDEKILALQVELGELANEWRGFKFWSNDQEPRTEVYTTSPLPDEPLIVKKNPLLEEYVDCLHFILSIGLEIGYYDTFYLKASYPEQGNRTNEFITERFNDCFRFANMMSEDNYFNELVQYFFDLGYLLGFTWEQVVDAYYQKNEINHERQENGY